MTSRHQREMFLGRATRMSKYLSCLGECLGIYRIYHIIPVLHRWDVDNPASTNVFQCFPALPSAKKRHHFWISDRFFLLFGSHGFIETSQTPPLYRMLENNFSDPKNPEISFTKVGSIIWWIEEIPAVWFTSNRCILLPSAPWEKGVIWIFEVLGTCPKAYRPTKRRINSLWPMGKALYRKHHMIGIEYRICCGLAGLAFVWNNLFLFVFLFPWGQAWNSHVFFFPHAPPKNDGSSMFATRE